MSDIHTYRGECNDCATENRIAVRGPTTGVRKYCSGRNCPNIVWCPLDQAGPTADSEVADAD